MTLNIREIDEIEALLAKSSGEDCLSYRELHGLLSALAVGPLDLTTDEKLNLIIYADKIKPENTNINIPAELTDNVSVLDKQINATLLSGDTLKLPCKLEIKNNKSTESLDEWLGGFFEAFFIDENAWYIQNEEDAAQMLLPFFLCFDEIDDPELDRLRKNSELFQKIANELPHALQDLYLFYGDKS